VKLPALAPLTGLSRRVKSLLGAVLLLAIALPILGATNMLRRLQVPTTSMSPALVPGDHVVMEGFSFLRHQPRRGDIVVFKTEGSQFFKPGTLLAMRVSGLPGEQLRIANGGLFVNGNRVILSNAVGEIRYVNPMRTTFLNSSNDTVIVPAGHYFVIGDNTANSVDSRFWGTFAASNILGRICFCCWPPRRIGAVH
jgi:signal peptidase I